METTKPLKTNEAAQVLPQILSDNSVAYNVRLAPPDDDRINLTIGCVTKLQAERLAALLNNCSWFDLP